MMDFYKVPIGFGMALAMNEPAMAAYAAMTEQQLDGILDKIGTAKFEEYLVKLNRSGILQGKALQKDYTQMIRWYTEDMAS